MISKINKSSYFIIRDLCEHLYVSLFHMGESGTELINKKDGNCKIYSNQIDFNFFEVLPFLTYDLLLQNKALLYFKIEADVQNNKCIFFHEMHNNYKIRRRDIYINNKKVSNTDLCNYVVITLSKQIKSKKINRKLNSLSKINTMATSDVLLTQSIPIDFKWYEEKINLFALKETKEIGGLIGYDQDRLNLTGYYAYTRELRKKILQYELFFNVVDEINKHFLKFSTEIGMDIELKVDKKQYEELKSVLSKMKNHEIDLLEVGELLYNR
ncbi:MAG: hypothetical protein E7372_04980 [Clostridiales bacterium]|nr:hypothetical protein [Clostridiales bacterium]